MSRHKIHFLFLVIFLLARLLANGQAARSPFSSYGLGEQFGNGLTHNQGMGGIGVSNPQFWYINSLNPALLVYNRLTAFEAGLIGEKRTQVSDSLTQQSGSGNLNYLVLSVPIKPGWWTSSVSLMPFTRLNYQLKYQGPVEGTTGNTVEIIEVGSGGINQFSWSNGVSLNKNISIGLRASYLFSATVSEYSSVLSQTAIAISPKIYDRTFVSDFQFSPGFSLRLDSLTKKNYRLNFGVVYDFKANLNAKFYQRVERWSPVGIIDSLTTISNQPGTITIPGNLIAGLSFTKPPYRWMAAVDASYADYSQYRDLTGGNPYQANNWRVSAGLEITPDHASLSNYLKRVTYRTGVSLEKYPYLVNGTAVKDFGITFGLSLPVNRVSSLDLALKVGKKGDRTLNTIEENYIKLYFGITFNDQWFIKRRFD